MRVADVPIVNGAKNSIQPAPINPGVPPASSVVPKTNTSPAQSTTPTTNYSSVPGPVATPKTKSNSPWDDDLEPTEINPPASPAIIGSLDPQAPQSINENSSPLKVPENVEEKVGQKLPASDFVNKSNQETSPNLPPQKEPSNGLFGGLFSKKKTPESVTPPVPIAKPNILPDTQPVVEPTANSSSATTKNINPLIKKILILVPGLIVVFTLASFLTEMGLLSIGIEKVYGALGAEQLWGGLSAKTETALGRSVLAMQDHSDFKATGKISITIDTAIKSDIVDPLLSLSMNKTITRDESINPSQKAVLTATDDYYFTTNSNSNSNSNGNLNSNTNSIVTPPTNANSNSYANENSNYSSGITEAEEPIGGTKIVDGSFDLKTSSQNNEVNIKLDDLSGSSITLINDSDQLLVKTTGSVNYGIQDETKWVTFDLDKIENKSITKSVFNLKTDAGFSVKGSRISNEKVSNTRCYKYKVESLEIGSSLADIGITSDMLPTLSGEVWIGIKDKLIHKMNIKITTPVSSAVRMVNLEMNLFDFDVKNSITKVASSDRVAPENLTGDAKRKEDVRIMLAALEKYKNDNDKYPVSTDLLKLDTADNVIYKALVPRYLTSLPVDPKSAEGWYYAYKSADGNKCSISSRLENTSDTEGALINNVLLYLKYSSD